jgi:hypothetical protein
MGLLLQGHLPVLALLYISHHQPYLKSPPQLGREYGAWMSLSHVISFSGPLPLYNLLSMALFFRLLTASGHQKLLRTAKRSAFQPDSIKSVGAKTIQNQHKHIIG